MVISLDFLSYQRYHLLSLTNVTDGSKSVGVGKLVKTGPIWSKLAQTGIHLNIENYTHVTQQREGRSVWCCLSGDFHCLFRCLPLPAYQEVPKEVVRGSVKSDRGGAERSSRSRQKRQEAPESCAN